MKRSPARSKKKPRFIRSDADRLKRLGQSWRKSRGVDGKIRKEIFGKPRKPRAGFGRDRRDRAVHPSGYREVIVHNSADLDGIDALTQAVRISSGVGLLKREKILAKADELRIRVLNR